MAERILFRCVRGFDHGRVTQVRAVQDSTSFVVLLYAVVLLIGIMFIQPRADSSRTMCTTVVVFVFVTVQHSTVV